MRVLELGSYVAPAYAGMILAEQGHDVCKLIWQKTDPIHGLYRGNELWSWINHRKALREKHLSTLLDGSLESAILLEGAEIVLDNIRPCTLDKYGIDPERLARDYDLIWVSLRPDVGERSFDVVAQRQAWGGIAPWCPFYIADTTAGLWMVMKALSQYSLGRIGHSILYQASLAAKLVEGELVIDVERDGKRIPWDVDDYYADDTGAHVLYRGERIDEPIRDRAWKWKNLRHDGAGRIVV